MCFDVCGPKWSISVEEDQLSKHWKQEILKWFWKRSHHRSCILSICYIASLHFPPKNVDSHGRAGPFTHHIKWCLSRVSRFSRICGCYQCMDGHTDRQTDQQNRHRTWLVTVGHLPTRPNNSTRNITSISKNVWRQHWWQHYCFAVVSVCCIVDHASDQLIMCRCI